ncbi:hypothetical protein M427DRAFT_382947 [Gonapodya prolifera JEL478]|uniref:Uncharacterized protein n=1 Tax=Gonapodya prolifera (strain JEL478) TaxID=1344416 RepID=A0A139AA15_GONPJ|nr:hypothetical protein M427DRAFT_382947 [Gonapodya prolifera JEL478]|eukprot:KXS13335.1 hypothetical protein M427DRAFT_382947 [Gonapodya prolifera JEL478]
MKVALNASAECFGNLVVTFEKPSAMTIETGCQDCSRFFNTLDDLKDRYNYFMELRPELVPTRSHWLDVLMSEIKSAGAFWILGPSACVSEGGVTNARSGHVSPFSVFGLDAGLVKFVAKVRDAFPPFDGCPRGCTTGRFDILGIQSTFRQFLEDPAHPLLYRAAASAKMVRARTIVDLCGSVVRADQVHAALPDAALVHATLAPAGPSSTETAEDLNALTPPPPVPIDEPASAPDADPLTLYLASKDGRPYLPHWPAELHPAPASVYRAILDRFVAVFPEMRCCMDLLTRPGMIEPLYEEEQRANATHPWEREALPMYITHYTPLKARKQYLR